MTHILRLDASSRPSSVRAAGEEGSYSRDLADHVIDRLVQNDPQATVTVRDLVADPIPHIADDTIKGYYTPPEAMTETLREATALSDRLIAEVRQADVIVLSAPIYNFSVPSALKAWIDHVVRIGHSFAYEEGSFRGLIEGKRAYMVLSYGAGGYGEDGPFQAYDFLKPYLTMIFNFIGISDVHAFAIEATTADAETITRARQQALAAIDSAFDGQEAA